MIGRDTGDFLNVGALKGVEAGACHRNCPASYLVHEALRRGEARLSADGALVAMTGAFTGRSPRDKYVVAHPSLEQSIDWGERNQPISPDRFADIRARALTHLRGRELFIQDLFAGADPNHRLKVRVVTEQAWHNLFARNMFIRPARAALAGFEPDWVVLQLPSFDSDPTRDGTRSKTAIVVDFAARLVLIAGTAYAGEIKKSIFTVMNYLLPEAGVMPMHCSANMDRSGTSALFFGLSGTGKTTLSADPRRILIGDDEHGWGPAGIFNFEGGCYAKVIRLDPTAEPEIFAASNRFGAVLENVELDPQTGEPLFESQRFTENTRSSYPIEFIPNASSEGTGSHPANLVMLTADAFGVLPPIAKLTPQQAMYHFLSGYTAKLAGTERGVTEPQAVFSACFGAPFMPRHPTVYADLLGRLIDRHQTNCWLVNTGWTGGGHGVGQRMPIAATRALLSAALAGTLKSAPTRIDPHFGLVVPTACDAVDPAVLDPRSTWSDRDSFDRTATMLVRRFAENFARFETRVEDSVRDAALRPAA